MATVVTRSEASLWSSLISPMVHSWHSWEESSPHWTELSSRVTVMLSSNLPPVPEKHSLFSALHSLGRKITRPRLLRGRHCLMPIHLSTAVALFLNREIQVMTVCVFWFRFRLLLSLGSNRILISSSCFLLGSSEKYVKGTSARAQRKIIRPTIYYAT